MVDFYFIFYFKLPEWLKGSSFQEGLAYTLKSNGSSLFESSHSVVFVETRNTKLMFPQCRLNRGAIIAQGHQLKELPPMSWNTKIWKKLFIASSPIK